MVCPDALDLDSGNAGAAREFRPARHRGGDAIEPFDRLADIEGVGDLRDEFDLSMDAIELEA